MYYYLNAALERRRGHARQAEAWLAQADAHYTPASEQVFAESFRSLGWCTEHSERLIAAARRHDPSSTTPAAMAVVELIPGETPAETPGKNSAALVLPPASVSSLKPAFRTTAPSAPAASLGDPEAAQMPPSDDNANDLPDRGPAAGDAAQESTQADPRAVYARPIVLGRPGASGSKPKATPSDSAAPASASATPASAPTASPAPSASPASSAPPKPEFTAKYEQAYIQFLQKEYAAARKLLDEADAIQPGQTTSITLRAQIFKHFYETAYAAYKQRADYVGAIAQLDEADTTQPNQPDALKPARVDVFQAEGLRARRIGVQACDLGRSPVLGRAVQLRGAAVQLPQLHRGPFAFRRAQRPNRCFQAAARGGIDPVQDLPDAFAGRQGGRGALVHGTPFFHGKNAPRGISARPRSSSMAAARTRRRVEIDSAAKDFVTQPKLVDIFKESFYRIGWLNDPNNPATGVPPTAASVPAAVAEATPADTAAPSPGARGGYPDGHPRFPPWRSR